MKQQYAQGWPQFFTAIIQGWKHLLKEGKYKNIIINSPKFLATVRMYWLRKEIGD